MTATSTAPAVAAWVVLGPLAAILITIAAGRLLGARRGWASMLISGVVGWTCAVLATGALAGWEWDTANMVLVALAFGTLFTMMTAIGLDLLAPRGSLARGERAGLITVGNPLRGVRQAARPIRRYREVLQLARANGVTRQRPTAQALPPGLSQTLEQAGGMFVKLGQVASTRPDLLPPEWCEELARLRSQAEPASEESIRPVLEVELGQPVDQLYGSFDWRPMASASIAQVYPAELPDGRSVVVKVQRPGLDDLIARDGAAIMQLAGLVERRTPLGLAVRPTELAAEFIGNVQRGAGLPHRGGQRDRPVRGAGRQRRGARTGGRARALDRSGAHRGAGRRHQHRRYRPVAGAGVGAAGAGRPPARHVPHADLRGGDLPFRSAPRQHPRRGRRDHRPHRSGRGRSTGTGAALVGPGADDGGRGRRRRSCCARR